MGSTSSTTDFPALWRAGVGAGKNCDLVFIASALGSTVAELAEKYPSARTDITGYLTDAVKEALDETEVGLGPAPGSDTDDWVNVQVSVGYEAPYPYLGDLVVDVPASDVGPARRFRVVLEEISPDDAVASQLAPPTPTPPADRLGQTPKGVSAER